MRGGARPIVCLIAAAVCAAAAPTPPPTPVPPFGSASPFPTRLVTPRPSTRPPKLSAPSAELADLDTGQVLYEKAARTRRPIASVTKIMTALVVLERLDPSATVTAGPDAARAGGARLGLRAGERITVRNLLYALLLSSANDAAVALSDAVAGSVPAFVRLMDRRAGALGLRDTLFTSPSGLDDAGYSSASDLIALTREAYARPLFTAIVRTKFWDVPAPSGPARHLENRNALLWLYPGAVGVKTGSTARAGHCLVAAAGGNGRRVAAVVLGAPVEAFDDAASLLNFGLLEFSRTVVVSRGETIGAIGVDGVTIPVVAAGDLITLVRKDLSGTIERRLRPVAGLALPIRAGDRIGTDEIRVEGRVIGLVPALAAISAPPSGAAPSPAGFASGLSEVFRVLMALIRALISAFL